MDSQHKMLMASQCRAGRAMIEWTQPKLAEEAGLGLSTIVDFEKDRRPISDAAKDMIEKALSKAGVIFVSENGDGPGVRLRKQK